MLPFTVIPFVKSKNIQGSCTDNSCNPINYQNNRDQDSAYCTEAYSSSSAEFYSSVIGESSSQSSRTPARLQRNKRRREITPSSYKILYNRICNDDIESVKDWFALYVPDDFMDDDHVSLLQTAVKSLSDESGCNIAMTAAAHKSYESLKFLLKFLPVLAEGKDNFGNTFNDVVRNLRDENLNIIVSKYSTKLETATEKLVSTIQSDEYCKQCSVFHCDPDHESSISHLFAENRDVPEFNPHLDPNNAGYKMMSKLGWSENKGLGPSEAGRKYLIKTQLKSDRRGLGIPEKNKPKVSHFEPNDVSSLQDNLLHKRKIKLKTESKRKRKKDVEKSRQWEIDFRRSMNEYNE